MYVYIYINVKALVQKEHIATSKDTTGFQWYFWLGKTFKSKQNYELTC